METITCLLETCMGKTWWWLSEVGTREKQIEAESQRRPSPKALRFGITWNTPGVAVKLQMTSSPSTDFQVSNTGPKARDGDRYKGTRNRGMRRLRWPLGARKIDTNVAESDRLQLTPAQPHVGNWPWKNLPTSLQNLISSSLKWDHKAYSGDVRFNEIRYT